MDPKITRVCVIVTIILSLAAGQFFDELTEENDGRPVYVLNLCPENQLFYPEEGGAVKHGDISGTCDCGPTFIYDAAKDKCFEAYRQGPCSQGEYLLLKNNVPTCVKNPCKTDKSVRYNNRCYVLQKSNGCPKKDGMRGVLAVNATSLAIQCIYGDVTELNLIQVSACPPGSKRISTGACRTPY